MIRTSVVIVAYKSSVHLENCLPPLVRDPCIGDIIVVDNSSEDAARALVGKFEGRVKYIDPRQNLGFAKACNLGARQTNDDVVTFLNPDVTLQRQLGELVRMCVNGKDSVWAGGLTKGPDKSTAINGRRAVTAHREFGKAIFGSRLALAQLPETPQVLPVPQVDGALLMTTRVFFEALNGYDERFELYFEDVDLCERARAVGKVLIHTEIYGSHESGSSAKQSASASYCVLRVSKVRYFVKKWKRCGAAVALLITGVETIARTLARQPEGLGVRWRALCLSAAEAARPGTVWILT